MKGGGTPNIIHTNIWYPPPPLYVKRTQKCGFDCKAEHSREFRGCYNNILIYITIIINPYAIFQHNFFLEMQFLVICNLCSQINSGHLALTCT